MQSKMRWTKRLFLMNNMTQHSFLFDFCKNKPHRRASAAHDGVIFFKTFWITLMHCLLWSIRSDNHSVLLWKVLFLSSVSSPDNKNNPENPIQHTTAAAITTPRILQVHDCVFLFSLSVFCFSFLLYIYQLLPDSYSDKLLLAFFPQKYSIPVRVRQ